MKEGKKEGRREAVGRKTLRKGKEVRKLVTGKSGVEIMDWLIKINGCNTFHFTAIFGLFWAHIIYVHGCVYVHVCVCMYVCMCVCVYERERERVCNEKRIIVFINPHI